MPPTSSRRTTESVFCEMISCMKLFKPDFFLAMDCRNLAIVSAFIVIVIAFFVNVMQKYYHFF